MTWKTQQQKDLDKTNSGCPTHCLQIIFNIWTDLSKMKTALFVSSKLTISEYLWCLNFPPAITKQVEKSNPFWSNLFWDTAPTSSAKFKHHNFSENVNFEGTNSVVSILAVSCSSALEAPSKPAKRIRPSTTEISIQVLKWKLPSKVYVQFYSFYSLLYYTIL